MKDNRWAFLLKLKVAEILKILPFENEQSLEWRNPDIKQKCFVMVEMRSLLVQYFFHTTSSFEVRLPFLQNLWLRPGVRRTLQVSSNKTKLNYGLQTIS